MAKMVNKETRVTKTTSVVVQITLAEVRALAWEKAKKEHGWVEGEPVTASFENDSTCDGGRALEKETDSVIDFDFTQTVRE